MSQPSPSFAYAVKTVEDAAQALQTSLTLGLTDQTAAAALAKHGRNVIGSHETRWWHILARQFRSPFIYLLVGAAVVAFVLGERLDAVFILVFILINSALGFYQEFRSDRSLKLLKNFITAHTTVVRGGKHLEVDVRELVPGDLLELQAGDIVPADCRVVEAEGLAVNESILTGESITANKVIDSLPAEPVDTYQAKNILFSGTTIATGRARALVVTTGRLTTVGSIAKLTTETVKESEFAKGIGRFSAFILRLVALTIGLIFLVNIWIKGESANIGELLLFSIALAISVIPEALPVVSIFSLSHGALQLAKKQVVVKRLSAIEDLGGIDVLCTDKTGTITENKLTVVDSLAVDTKQPLLVYGALAASVAHGSASGDPFDVALHQSLSPEDAKSVYTYLPIEEVPFDPVRRRNSVLVKSGKQLRLIVRGAAEEVLGCCTGEQIATYRRWLGDQGQRGRRILAIASRTLTKNPAGDLVTQEINLTLAGFIAFEDPIKETAKPAIDKARALGMQVKILTGDAPEVAGAVAKRIGLIADFNAVITGASFTGLSSAQQHDAVEKYAVFARISPEQKHTIVSMLDERHAVGFLGEGINDAPALKAAGVSIVVQGGADIAREAADVILLQKSLSVIIDGVQEGRRVFANTLKYIRATLSSNFGNFYAVAIGSLFIDFLPMLPVQILLVNLLSDFPMIAIATDTVSPADVARPQRYSVREIALIATLLGVVSTMFDFIFFALYFRISPQTLQTNWSIASIITELVFMFSIRTRKFAFTAQRPSTPLIWLSGLACLVAVGLPFTRFGQDVFHFLPPLPIHLVTIISLAALYFISSEIVKLFYYRFLTDRQPAFKGKI